LFVSNKINANLPQTYVFLPLKYPENTSISPSTSYVVSKSFDLGWCRGSLKIVMSG